MNKACEKWAREVAAALLQKLKLNCRFRGAGLEKWRGRVKQVSETTLSEHKNCSGGMHTTKHQKATIRGQLGKERLSAPAAGPTSRRSKPKADIPELMQ